jgi:outer membrane protein OmpA-like peptidoglycan-associated protein
VALVCNDQQEAICKEICLGVSILLCWAGLTFVTFDLQAGEVRDFGSRVPTQEEFIDALTPGEAAAPRMRGIRPVNPAAADTSKAVSMELTFKFNTARLSGDAKQILNNLGAALQDQKLKSDMFRVEGHTDSKGSAVYNQHLSQRRAQSVKDYLVGRFGIDSKRLETVGKGETAPLDPKDPENPANRRVQIVNLGHPGG